MYLTQIVFKYFSNKLHTFHLTPALVNFQVSSDETLIHETFPRATHNFIFCSTRQKYYFFCSENSIPIYISCGRCCRPATLLKRRLWHRCFPMNLAKFLRTPFCIEHLWWLLLTETAQWSICSALFKIYNFFAQIV